MEQGVAIAVAQTRPTRGDVQANLQQHLQLIQLAATEGAQVLVFPELSMTGYELELAVALAFSMDDARLLPLRQAAERHSLTLIVGAPVRLDDRLYLAAFVCSPDGRVELYTKHHLGAFSSSAAVDGVVPAPEARVFVAGTHNPLLHLGGWTAAIAICADVGHDEHAQLAVGRGARGYLASMFVIPSEFERESERLSQIAKLHAMPVAMANYCGSSGGLSAAGRSSIWSASGVLLVRLEASTPGVALARRSGSNWNGVQRTLSS